MIATAHYPLILGLYANRKRDHMTPIVLHRFIRLMV
nr:MAG TPA: hypothetical protein [Caudoviricetes sp.]